MVHVGGGLSRLRCLSPCGESRPDGVGSSQRGAQAAQGRLPHHACARPFRFGAAGNAGPAQPSLLLAGGSPPATANGRQLGTLNGRQLGTLRVRSPCWQGDHPSVPALVPPRQQAVPNAPCRGVCAANGASVLTAHEGHVLHAPSKLKSRSLHGARTDSVARWRCLAPPTALGLAGPACRRCVLVCALRASAP
jgi:hypothetical protein